MRCVFNGVTADEFDPIVLASDATDIVYVGEFRHIKGADLLIDAVARLRADGKPVTLTLAGDGEEIGSLKAQIQTPRPRRSGALHRPRQGALRLFQGQTAGRSLAREFDALRRDRGGRSRNSDDRRKCRRHSRDIWHAYRRAVCAQRRSAPWRTRSKPRSTIPPRALARAKIASRKNLHALFAEGHGRRGAGRLPRRVCQIVNRSLPTITVSSDLSSKP